MTEKKLESLVEEVEERYGDRLRAVASYDENDYRIEYLDDEVGERYSQEELDEIYEDLILDSFTSPYYESLFREMGRARAVFRVFEEGSAVYVCPPETDHGVYVAVDNEVDAKVESLVSLVESYCTKK